LLEFPGNETLLYLALYNIVENAIKYSYDKPVEITLSENNNQLNIEVKDQGKEFLLMILLKLLIRSTEGKNVDAIKGSGIGLSLSKSIFDHHHVIIMKIDSKINVGTECCACFSF
jgi:signal transduction histidine kinase